MQAHARESCRARHPMRSLMVISIARHDWRTYVVSRAIHVACKLSRRTTSAWMSVRYRWRSFAHRLDAPPPLQMVRRCMAIGLAWQDRLASGVAIGSAAACRLSQAGARIGCASIGSRGKRETIGSSRINSSSDPASLEPAQRRTLEMGSCILLSGLSLGFEFGSWPVWTFLAGIGVYVAWVVLYAEITVQRARRPAWWQSRGWHGLRKTRGSASPEAVPGSKRSWLRKERTPILSQTESRAQSARGEGGGT